MTDIKTGKILVTRQYLRSGKVLKEEEDRNENIEVHKFETEPAYTRCGLGMTINLGNYESLRVDCSVTLPTYKEELDDAQETAFRIASAELFKRVNEVKANL